MGILRSQKSHFAEKEMFVLGIIWFFCIHISLNAILVVLSPFVHSLLIYQWLVSVALYILLFINGSCLSCFVYIFVACLAYYVTIDGMSPMAALDLIWHDSTRKHNKKFVDFSSGYNGRLLLLI